ncbi:MAG: nuclease-related domain-containing protein [Nitrospinaceae bacterium]
MAQQFLMVYWIKILAGLAVFIGLLALFFRQGKTQAGDAGNGPSLLSKIDRLGKEYTLLRDIVIPARNGMIRIDHVVVSPYGIFVILVKNQAGKVRGRMNDREWIIKSGRRDDTIYNPLWEVRRMVNALEDFLGPATFIPAVVFPRARLKSDFGRNVIPLSRLPGFIKQHRKHVLFQDRQETVIERLKAGHSRG